MTPRYARRSAALIGCDIHPINNLGPLNDLRGTFNADNAAIQAWAAHWITQGFGAVERSIAGGDFCFGSAPSLADVYLVPQLTGARRFNVPLEAFPKIRTRRGGVREPRRLPAGGAREPAGCRVKSATARPRGRLACTMLYLHNSMTAAFA